MGTTLFIVNVYAGGRHPALTGSLLTSTTHSSESSAYVEVEAWKSRMLDGSVRHADLIDCRPGGGLTTIGIRPHTVISWSWSKLSKRENTE